MTVYIAVCDDNVADRKHTERLLEREKDLRLHTENSVLYIESFGSREALMHTPVKYDLFLIDINSKETNGMEIAKELRHCGVLAPIALLSSATDYTSFANEPDNIIHLKKESLNQGNIAHLFDVAKNWALNKPLLLEIRGKKETLFLPHKDLVRAQEKDNLVEVLVADGRFIEVPGNLKSFSSITSSFNCFILCKKSLINIYHISECDNNSFYLDNGEKYDYSPLQARSLLKDFVRFTSNEAGGIS